MWCASADLSTNVLHGNHCDLTRSTAGFRTLLKSALFTNWCISALDLCESALMFDTDIVGVHCECALKCALWLCIVGVHCECTLLSVHFKCALALCIVYVQLCITFWVYIVRVSCKCAFALRMWGLWLCIVSVDKHRHYLTSVFATCLCVCLLWLDYTGRKITVLPMYLLILVVFDSYCM